MNAIDHGREQGRILTAAEMSGLTGATMKALVYHGPGLRAWEEKPRPRVLEPTDAVVRITTSTICGTDLHILKGDVPTVSDGRILGHEGVGVVEEVGAAVSGCALRGQGPHLLHHVLREVRVLPEGDVLALPPRRLDPRQHDRRHAGRVRPDPARRHQPPRAPARRRRGGDGDAERHPPDRLRVRCPQRPGEAGRHGRDRRRRPDRPRRAVDRAAVFARRDRDDRRRRPTGSRWHAPSGARTRSTAATAGPSRGSWR